MNETITPKGENGAVKTKSKRENLDTAATGAFAVEETAERIDSRRGIKDVMEHVMKAIFLICGLVAIAFVLVISVYLIVSGIPAIREVGLWNFLTGDTWDPANNTTGALFGILPMILTSIYGTCGAIIIGVPIGFLMAVYLSKVANRKVASVIREVVDLLAGIPSVVYGLVGMMVLLPAIRNIFNIAAGDSLLAAIIVLAIMILPSIISVSETALNAVPREYEEASLALGATGARDLLPRQRPRRQERHRRRRRPRRRPRDRRGHGHTDGRRHVANMPSLLSSVKFLTTAIAGEMGYAGDLHRQALFSIGLVLFVFIMLINAALNLFLKRNKEGN